MTHKLTAYLTGATGFIGYNIADILVKNGWDVYALYRNHSDTGKLQKLGVKLVYGHLGDTDSLKNGMPDKVDSVFHTAGNVSFEKTRNKEQNQDNIEGTRNIIQAAIYNGCKRFIYTSSAATFGIHKELIKEETKSNALEIPINYFHSKTLAEEIVKDIYKAGDLDTVILNPANVVGPHDTKIWGPFVLSIVNGTLTSIGSGTGSFCHVKSVANAHLNAFKVGKSGHQYLLAGTTATFYEVCEIISNLCNCNKPLITKGLINGLSDEISQLMNYEQRINCKKAIDELEFETVTLEKMFGDLLEWLRFSGQLK
tara:strand:- start:8759 stop:9694 length:936 start_codon:yes stop_codon:yes gene_type:complete